MQRLTVKRWSDFQHYTGRRPPWLKLHRALLDDYEFHCLPDASRALAPMMWLLASESEDGAIDFDVPRLAFRLRMTPEAFKKAVDPLINGGFLLLSGDASDVLAPCKQVATPEKERETELETDTDTDFRSPSASKKSEVKASRLPSDWLLPPDWRAWAVEHRPDIDPDLEADKFRDFWHGKAGKDGRKADWLATWRNWIRNARAGPAHGGRAVPIPSKPEYRNGFVQLASEVASGLTDNEELGRPVPRRLAIGSG